MRLTRLRFGPVKLAMETYFNHLNGVFCIYKPTGFSTPKAIALIKNQILKDLNDLPAYDHEIEKHYKEKDSLPPNRGGSSIPMTTTVPETITDYSNHKLVLGDMFISDDIDVRYLHGLERHGSGVVVCGIGKEGKNNIDMIQMAKYLRVYHVKGRLGYATQNYFTDGHFIERSTFRHINKGKLDKVCSAAQSGHQRLMFQCAGVNPSSQEAYELASQGLVRPSDDSKSSILYGVKCIDFNPPDFTLEVHAINEDNNYLAQLVNDIGLQLKSTAVCTHIHRLRYGIFGLNHTLLRKEWNLPEIARNICNCEALLTPENLFTNIQLTPKDDEGKHLDLLGQSVTKNEGPSKEELLRLRALKELSDLREKLLEEAKSDCGDSFKNDMKFKESSISSSENKLTQLSCSNRNKN